MQYILSKTSLPIVTRLAHERTLCAFDFDGTLSSIVDHPDHAVMRARTENLLRRLALLYPCLIVSGRARADVLRRMSGVHVAQVIGNHGAETGSPSRPHHRVDRWKAALELELGPVPGLWVEDKGISLAIHYRQTARKADARRRILAATRKLERARVFGGKQVVNVVGDGVPNKGDAVAAERDRLKCTWVLYVGDDENDEDAFALCGNMVPVRIGRKLRSHARYFLRAQKEIDNLLELLLRLREPVAAR
ncbi:MAG: trehalose-phosphatase [Terracidiphilus sp.]|jgi:trehalose 6-phosphate phosphatase